MKKIITLLFAAAAVCSFPLFLSSADKTPVDFSQLNKAIVLFKEAAALQNDGQSVKSEKKRNEAYKIIDTIFKKGKTITAAEGCYFRKVRHEVNMLELSCGDDMLEDGGKLVFEFNTTMDRIGGVKKNLTPDSVVEVFEGAQNFTGKIQILENKDGSKHAITIYDIGDRRIDVNVHCKILSLKAFDAE